MDNQKRADPDEDSDEDYDDEDEGFGDEYELVPPDCPALTERQQKVAQAPGAHPTYVGFNGSEDSPSENVVMQYGLVKNHPSDPQKACWHIIENESDEDEMVHPTPLCHIHPLPGCLCVCVCVCENTLEILKS